MPNATQQQKSRQTSSTQGQEAKDIKSNQQKRGHQKIVFKILMNTSGILRSCSNRGLKRWMQHIKQLTTWRHLNLSHSQVPMLLALTVKSYKEPKKKKQQAAHMAEYKWSLSSPHHSTKTHPGETNTAAFSGIKRREFTHKIHLYTR